MDKFQVGDWAQPLAFDDTAPPFEVKEIFSDGFGRVLLSEPGGYGYGEQYCVKVEPPHKKENQNDQA